MGLGTTVLLGAVAGFTIYLGLPIARVRRPRPGWAAFLNALATGVLLFLLWDILGKANEPVEAALDGAKKGDAGAFAALLALFVVGFGAGLLGLVYFARAALYRSTVGATTAHQLALMIATGIGLHNFSEGLAIGQASRAGELELAAVLIVGFALHNATEGFGIAGPLAVGSLPSWGFLGVLGLIGGGPTLAGTLLGYAARSTPVFVLCLALAAGSILYVVGELLHVGRGFQRPVLVAWGVSGGFLAGYATDLLLTWSGA